MAKRVFYLLEWMSSGCATLPLVAALALLGSARWSAWTPTPAPVTAAVVTPEISPDQARILSVLEKRAPELGLTLREQLGKAIAEEALQAGYAPLLILAIIDVESDFEEEAVSNMGARGLMQIKPSTLHFLAEKQGLRLSREEVAKDPALCLRLGVRYLRQLQDRMGGDLDLALMAYNAGPARIRVALREKDVERFRKYPAKVRREFRRFREGEGLGGDWTLAQRASKAPPAE